MKSWSIYALCDPANGRVRYIGFTTELVAKRLRRHLSNALSQKINIPVYDWIRKLQKNNLQPSFTILETGIGEWESRERWWIAHFRLLEYGLLNRADGGYRGIPSEARKRAGQKLRGKKHTEETRAKMSLAKQGCKRPDNILRNKLIDNRGKKLRLTDSERERRRIAGRLSAAQNFPNLKRKLEAQ